MELVQVLEIDAYSEVKTWLDRNVSDGMNVRVLALHVHPKQWELATQNFENLFEAPDLNRPRAHRPN